MNQMSISTKGKKLTKRNKILELKSIIIENSSQGLNSRFEKAEESVNLKIDNGNCLV